MVVTATHLRRHLEGVQAFVVVVVLVAGGGGADVMGAMVVVLAHKFSIFSRHPNLPSPSGFEIHKQSPAHTLGIGVVVLGAAVVLVVELFPVAATGSLHQVPFLSW